jgi:hypothetical protein
MYSFLQPIQSVLRQRTREPLKVRGRAEESVRATHGATQHAQAGEERQGSSCAFACDTTSGHASHLHLQGPGHATLRAEWFRSRLRTRNTPYSCGCQGLPPLSGACSGHQGGPSGSTESRGSGTERPGATGHGASPGPTSHGPALANHGQARMLLLPLLICVHWLQKKTKPIMFKLCGGSPCNTFVVVRLATESHHWPGK